MLDRVRAVFWNLGYAATSLDDLAAATGLNRPSLYAAFGDKRALYLAALRRSADEGIGALSRALRSPARLREVLTAVMDRTVDLYRAGELAQRGCFVIGTAVTQAVEDPEVRAVTAGFIADIEALFRRRFEQDAPDLAPGVRPDAAAAIATGTLHTLAVRARAGFDEVELKRVGHAAVDVICGPDGRA